MPRTREEIIKYIQDCISNNAKATGWTVKMKDDKTVELVKDTRLMSCFEKYDNETFRKMVCDLICN